MKDNQFPEKTRVETPKKEQKPPKKFPAEHGGYQGPEPTKFGDWSYKGRCVDF